MRRLLLTSWLVLIALLLVGCRQELPTGGTAELLIDADSSIPDVAIVADGRVVPMRWVHASFPGGGMVTEVFVSPGDTVMQGAELAQLGGSQQAEAVVALAQAELLAARQARQALEDQLPAERARALQALMTARQAVTEAEAQLAYLDTEASAAEAEGADARLVMAEAALEEAQEDYADYADEERGNATRARLQIALTGAQVAYQEALSGLDAYSDSARDERVEFATDALAAARLQLTAAQALYDRLQEDEAPEVVAADARIEAAERQLVAAQEALGALTLTAPIAGTVIQVGLRVGESASPGVSFVALADLSEWWIETDNLTQTDIVAIEAGDEVTVIIDALPELPFTGEVMALDRFYQDKRGEVTYTAHLRLNGTDPRLRWGMTCAVTFAGP
jgi:multidrug efflux pump subunit AcrA (membrane-fusion protein)